MPESWESWATIDDNYPELIPNLRPSRLSADLQVTRYGLRAVRVRVTVIPDEPEPSDA